MDLVNLCPHKIEDVLEIDIGGTIIPCIVLGFQFHHTLKSKEKYIMCRSVFAFEMLWPHSPLVLKNREHSICIADNSGEKMKNCYELLMGDEKIWLQYANSL